MTDQPPSDTNWFDECAEQAGKAFAYWNEIEALKHDLDRCQNNLVSAEAEIDRLNRHAPGAPFAWALTWPDGQVSFTRRDPGEKAAAMDLIVTPLYALSPPEIHTGADAPGHDDLMVTPESIDAWLKDNPLPEQCPKCGRIECGCAASSTDEYDDSVSADDVKGILAFTQPDGGAT